MTSTTEPSFGPLLGALFDAFEVAGAPIIPAGRREDVASLLNKVMMDPNLFTDYIRALDAERTRRGLKRRLLALPTGDIPEDAIARNGFTELPPDLLAEIALSPEALKALEQVIHEEDSELELGNWFYQEELNELNGAEPTARAERAEPQGTQPSNENRSRTGRKSGFMWGGAIAASLLVGIGLGLLLRTPDERPQTSLGSVNWVPGRGTDRVPVIDIRNTGRRTAFVTLVGIAPNDHPRVFDKSNNRYLSVAPGRTLRVENFDALLPGATVYVVITTETPAGDALRGVFPNDTRPEQSGQLEELTSSALRELGYRAFQVQVLRSP